MKSLLTRTITGIVFLVVLLGAIWINSLSFIVFFSVIAFLCTYECLSLRLNDTELPFSYKIITCCIGLLLFLSVFTSIVLSNALFVVFPIVALLILLSALLYQKEMVVKTISAGFFCLLYPLLPMLSIIVLAFMNKQGIGDIYNPILLTALFTMIWVNDIGAYIIGVSFGKNRLWERISPKKSWEGFYAGLVFSMVLGYCLPLFGVSMTHIQGAIWGVLVSVFGTYGDLFESVLKRSAQVKDSGTILPGHGGLLDRFDSILFAGPISVLYIWLLI